jgi:hypothetical protein
MYGSHYYINFYRGGCFSLTEVGKPTASDQRSWLIMALIEAVNLPATVNTLTEASELGQPP